MMHFTIKMLIMNDDEVLWFLIYAEVVTFEAGSLEAGGLPRYPEVLV
jgi:hypothetical protein